MLLPQIKLKTPKKYKSDKELQQSFNTNSFKLELSTKEWKAIIEQKNFDEVPIRFGMVSLNFLPS